MWLSRQRDGVKECGVCREELQIWREIREGHEDRVVATDRVTGKQHVCFDLPQDANLLVLEDHDV